MAEKKKLTKKEKWFRTLRRVERWGFRLLYPYKLHGNYKKYNDEKGLIVVGNHYGMLDPAFPLISTDKPVTFMAKKELWEKKGIVKWVLEKCDGIPVNRDGTDVRALMTAIRRVKEGGVVCIYPEGTRNKNVGPDDDFLPFKPGAAAMSIRTKTPILPIVLVNKIRLFRRTDVIFGDLIEFSEYYDKKLTEEDLEKCDKLLRDTMLKMRKDFIEGKKKK